MKILKNPDFKWLKNSLETRLYIQHSAADIPLSFEAFFYQTTNYLNSTSSKKKLSFYLFRTGKIASIACIHFTRNDIGFISPAHAPFGGIQSDKECHSYEINFLLLCVENWFSSHTDCLLRIKTAPECYITTTELFTIAYKLAGYKIIDKFTNYHIPISQSAFFEHITSSELRRLDKCRKSGFRASLYESPDIEIVFKFIEESRRAKGYLMSMTLTQLAMLINNFPEHCRVFVVTDEDKIIALTVNILVSKRVMYNFLPTDLPAYKSFSPNVYLTEEIYNYCQKEKIEILDLGISLDNNGNEKPGLLKFKKNLGGKKSFKITYEKHLNSQTIPVFVKNS